MSGSHIPADVYRTIDGDTANVVYDRVQATASQSPAQIRSVGTKTVLQFYDRYNAGDIDGGAFLRILALSQLSEKIKLTTLFHARSHGDNRGRLQLP